MSVYDRWQYMQGHLAELSVLYNVSRMANRSLLLDDVLQAIVNALDFEGGFLALRDNGRSYLASSHNLSPGIERFLRQREADGNLCAPINEQPHPLIMANPYGETSPQAPSSP